MGCEPGTWPVFISPSHWATLEIGAGKNKKGRGGHQDTRKKDDEKDS